MGGAKCHQFALGIFGMQREKIHPQAEASTVATTSFPPLFPIISY
jgi:hypothetical protein